MTRSARVRVVVVEDSAVQRAHLVHTLQAEGDIEVVGEAEGGREAVEVVGRLRPDVVTLDLLMPDGGGQYAIEQIMGHTPTPILVLSATVDSRASRPAIEALVAGAVEALPKPGRWTPLEEATFRRTVRALRGVTVLHHPRALVERSSTRAAGSAGSVSPAPIGTASIRPATGRPSGDQVVAIAASTGGPQALATVLSGLGALTTPVLVVQHIHPDFVDGLVHWMAKVSELHVRRAVAGERLEAGTVYVGPGGVHLRVGPDRRITLDPDPVTIHRPSADELLQSMAQHVGADGIGVVLTGMGNDGAAGLLALRRAGGTTIAQDASSSAVFGMPSAAQRAGAVVTMLPLDEIAPAILQTVRRARR